MSNAVPAISPDTSAANLPATYTAAQQAIAELDRVDECKSWSDKAAALASYARQANDDSLRVMAVRIQARAERRCGELLKQIPRADIATRYGKDGTVPPVTRTSAAIEAGLSERQRKTALRVANVPQDEFEAALASDAPPTVSALAERGRVHRQPYDSPIPADPAQAAKATALLREFAAFCGANDPARIACSSGVDTELARGYVSTIDTWLDRFVTRLPSGKAA
jgi:hypothetical protein